MQCKRCKTFFKYDKYDGICPQCAYFNRPPGMEEVDLFEDDKRFQAENYVLPQMEGIHMELHKKYDSDKKPHKKKKTAKNNVGHFSDYLERKAKENMETKKDAANSRVSILKRAARCPPCCYPVAEPVAGEKPLFPGFSPL